MLRGPSGVAGVFAWSGGMSDWPPFGRGGAPAAPERALGGCLVFPGFIFAWGALLSVVGKAGGSIFWPSGSEDVIELELRFSASSHVPCL